MSGIGPALPPHLAAARAARQQQQEEEEEAEQKQAPATAAVGPALPPHLAAARLRRQQQATDTHTETHTETHADARAAAATGPTASAPSDSDSEDDELVGPAPPPAGALSSAAQAQTVDVAREFELRAERRRAELTGEDSGPKQREGWMTELPETFRKDFDAGESRGFRQAYGSGTRGDASWTETPADRELKRQQREAAAAAPPSKKPARVVTEEEVLAAAADAARAARDREVAAQVAEYNAQRRGESLMEKHARQRRKEFREKEARGGEEISRRFDRERDLVPKKISAQKREELLSKAANFGSRFTSGTYST